MLLQKYKNNSENGVFLHFLYRRVFGRLHFMARPLAGLAFFGYLCSGVRAMRRMGVPPSAVA